MKIGCINRTNYNQHIGRISKDTYIFVILSNGEPNMQSEQSDLSVASEKAGAVGWNRYVGVDTLGSLLFLQEFNSLIYL